MGVGETQEPFTSPRSTATQLWVSLGVLASEKVWVSAALTWALPIPVPKPETSDCASTQAQASAASAQAIVLGVSTGMPSIRPSFLADFANSRAIDPRITITRPSTAFRVNQFGLPEQVASGVGRIDFSPVALNCRGLLIEESRANLLTYSEQFDNGAWTKTRATVSANAAIAPDGTTTADKLIEDTTASNSHFVTQNYAATNTTLSGSFFVKSAERSKCRIEISNFLNHAAAVDFDLTNGSFVVSTAGATDYTNTQGSIVNAGNGWWRISITATKGSANSNNFLSLSVRNDAGNTIYTGDGTSGLYVWRAKLEAGSFPTSPDQTVASTVTRAADSATVTGTSFSSWYRQDEGSVIVTARSAPGVGSVDQHVFSLTDSGGTNRITLYRNTSRFAVLVIDVGGVTQATLTSVATWADNTVAKIGVSFKAGSFALSLDGAAAVTAASGSVPTVDRLVLGNTVAGTRAFNGWIERFGFFPKQISNSELVAGATQ